jgi:hypothetical protein
VSHRTHARTMGPKSITRYGERFGLLLFKVDRRRRRIEVSARRMCVCERVGGRIVCVTCVHVHHANAQDAK